MQGEGDERGGRGRYAAGAVVRGRTRPQHIGDVTGGSGGGRVFVDAFAALVVEEVVSSAELAAASEMGGRRRKFHVDSVSSRHVATI